MTTEKTEIDQELEGTPVETQANEEQASVEELPV
ncbi:MAG: hypothetical protein RIT22_2119, partial [Bacteroidota bacterium]